ncbi:MAG: PilN domain-containing protein [Thermodesulfobacteriota bacterium]
MIFYETSFGIDFMQDHLALAVLRRSFGKISLAGYEIHPMPPPMPVEDREAHLIGLINAFVLKYQVDKDRVSISIPRRKTVARFITLPVATKENLRKVLEYETSKYTPFEKGEVYFDYLILKEEKELIHLFSVFVKKEEVDPYLSLLKKIGIEPISIQISSMGALNLFFHNDGAKKEGASVLLDMSEPFSEMNILQGKDWKESFHLPLPSEKKELTVLSTVKRLGLETQLSSKGNLFVYGLDADEKVLEVLKETFPALVVSPPPCHRIPLEQGGPFPYRIYSSIGLPLKGLVKTRLELNLLPLEMQKKVRQIGKPVSIFLASLALLLGLTWGAGIFFRYRNELETVNAEIKKRKPEVEAVENLQKQKETMAKEIFDFEKIRSGETSKIDILKELTQLLPGTVWIWNFKYNGKEIEISGYADSAPELISLLDKSPLFERVEFLSPVTKDRQFKPEGDKEKERFRIKVRIEGRKS